MYVRLTFNIILTFNNTKYQLKIYLVHSYCGDYYQKK